MAEATINDVTKGLQQINETLRQQAIAEGKPDPVKFVKEEIVAILAERSYHKKDLATQQGIAKSAEDAEKIDQGYYDKQLSEQVHTSDELIKSKSYLEKIANGINNTTEQNEQIVLMLTDQTEEGKLKAREAERRRKAEAVTEKELKFLGKISGFLGGIFESGKKKVKSGLDGFKKFAFGALAVAALAFLNSPYFDKIYDIIVDKIIPLAIKIYEKYLKPLLKIMKEKLIKAFEDINKFLDGELDIFELLWNNKVVVAGFLAVFAPGVLLAPLKLGGGLILKGLKALYASKALVPFLTSLKSVLGPAAIITGVVMAIKDGIAGMDLAEEYGVSKISAFFGHLLGGMDTGLMGAFKNAGKFALMGVGIGSVVPVIGTLVGGLVGAAIGALLGMFGGEKISKAIDSLLKPLMDFFNKSTLKLKKIADKLKIRKMTESEKAELAVFEAEDKAEKVRMELVGKRKKQLELLGRNRRKLIENNASREAAIVHKQRKIDELEATIREKNLTGAHLDTLRYMKKNLDRIKNTNKGADEQIKAIAEQEKQLQVEISQGEKELKAKGFSVDKKTPDASSVKPKEKESVNIINANDQKVVKIDNKEEKTFIGATNMRSVDETAAIIAGIG